LIHRRILLESGFRRQELVLKRQEHPQKEPVMGRAGRPTAAIELTDEERETWNDNPRPFTWHKSAEEILDRLAGYCRSLNK
jgi:hypothetical protein